MKRIFSLLYNPWLWRGLMLFSLVFFAFLYGFIASELRWFPYKPLSQAVVAFDALAETAKSTSFDGLRSYKQFVDRPTVNWFHKRDTDDCILVSGGAAGYLTDKHPTGCLAWIIDREGHELHSWANDPQLWSDTKIVKQVPGLSGPANATGVHMFDNGELLVTFHGQNTYPFAVGMARVDRAGHVLWKKELLTHHFFSVDERGHIFVPALEVAESPLPIGDTDAFLVSETGKLYADCVLELDGDGNELRRVNLIDSLCRSGWHGELVRANSMHNFTDDPLHLNDVRVITTQEASNLPGIAAGDVLVSLRNINTLAIVDLQTGLMKWVSSGSTIGQHAPRIYKSGVLVLDNLGGDSRLGGSRLVHIDYASRRPQCVFPKKLEDMPDLCKTVNCGHLDIHSDGQYALMAVTHGGSVWEIDLASGQVLWEYIINDSRVPNTRGKIGYASYIKKPEFLDQ